MISRIPEADLATLVPESELQPAKKNGGKGSGPKRRKRRRSRKGSSGSVTNRDSSRDLKRAGGIAPFPRATLEEALSLGIAIQQHAAGQKIRRTTLFEKLNKSPDSGPSRALITNSSKYGITTGSYKADYLELTPVGARATDPEASARDKLRARFDLAIMNVPPFNFLYESLKGKRIPSPEVMRDSLSDAGVSEDHRKECVELFLENAKFLGLLRTTAGAERLAPIDQLLEELPVVGSVDTGKVAPVSHELSGDGKITAQRPESYDKVCFIIAPINDEGTEERKHSDMVLESLITRALEGEELLVIRADKLGDPGMISGQVINYLLRSRIVIADLSFHNPNVFYELAIRHMAGLPTVHIIRKDDMIPFDVKDFRTIVIDTSDKYDLVAKLDTYRAEIANHFRMATAAGADGSNPIRTHARNLVVRVD